MHASGTAIQIVVLGGKALIAVLLLVAGGAKLADLRGFAVTVRLFVPSAVPGAWSAALAGGIAAGEIACGAASLSVPRAGWLNSVVLGICCGFLAVWTVGYARHRGHTCRCFGALSRRGFTAAGVARAVGLVLLAAIALARVPAPSVQLSVVWQLALLAGAALVAGVADGAAAVAGG